MGEGCGGARLLTSQGWGNRETTPVAADSLLPFLLYRLRPLGLMLPTTEQAASP